MEEVEDHNEEEAPNEIKDFHIEENSKPNYAHKKHVPEGLMNFTLLTANANQLRFVLTYNTESLMYHISFGLIILSLVLQVLVGLGIILKRIRSKSSYRRRANQFHVVGIFIITFVNVLIAVFTTTGSYVKNDKTNT